MTELRRIVLLGNPNSGKTTLFNAWSGCSEQVGNWAGVTTECQAAQFRFVAHTIELVDLPGVYSLVPTSENNPCDEQVTLDYLDQTHIDLILNVVDIEHIQTHLYLTLQLLERGHRVVVLLQSTQGANESRLKPIEKILSQILSCPVYAVSHLPLIDGVPLDTWLKVEPNVLHLPYPDSIADALVTLTAQGLNRAEAFAYLDRDWRLLERFSGLNDSVHVAADADLTMAGIRYTWIEKQLACLSWAKPKVATRNWDTLFLHRFLGVPIFLVTMYLLFFWAIQIGGLFQEFFERFLGDFVFGGLVYGAQQLGAHGIVVALLQAIGSGVTTTLTFVPVLGFMFFGLTFLEESGYMSRVAVVVDRMMRWIGLPGKSLVPLIIGFGCNVPAIMATRSLETQRDRIVTVMMMPFMSCGARLAIFTVFAATFFPDSGHQVIFALYLIGIALALLTGFILDRMLRRGVTEPLLLELPEYRLPRLGRLLKQAGIRLRRFIVQAGKTIVPLCALLVFLNQVPMPGKAHPSVALEQATATQRSVLAFVGQSVTPIFYPMGVTQDNWPATVGLLSGMVAKEAVIGTLNALYEPNVTETAYDPKAALNASVASIGMQVQLLLGSVPEPEASPMANHFGCTHAAFSYLLFILLYMPCVSTVAVMIREVGRYWAYFSVVWTTALAYAGAVGYYQIVTWALHPWITVIWLVALLGCLSGLIWLVWHKNAYTRLLPTRIVVR
ncbi:MAG: ferrous iron transport protein B [Pseudomonadota bacterium]